MSEALLATGLDRPVSQLDSYSQVEHPWGAALSVPGTALRWNETVEEEDMAMIRVQLDSTNTIDWYSTGLQIERIRKEHLANKRAEQQLRIRERALEILESGSARDARRFRQLMGELELDDTED